MTKCLYVVYWGATEPLGLALVLPVVEALAERGEEIYLITFDKPADRTDALVTSIASRLHARGVRWIDLTYHKRPRNWSTGLDIARGLAVGGYLVLRHRIPLVHGRTYVGGIIAWLLGAMLPVRVIFHNDGFWPEEQVDAGVWTDRSRAFRLARFLARAMYRRADGLVVLSERALDLVRQDPDVAATPVTIAPSGVDVARFARPRVPRPDGVPLRLIYVGGLGGRYPIGPLVDLFALAMSRYRGTHCRIASRHPAEEVAPHLARWGLGPGDVPCAPVPAAAVPALLAEQDAGVHLLSPGKSSAGGSPTKVGEYLAAGLPVVTTADAGDLDAILRKTRTGVVLRSTERIDLERGLDELTALLADEDLDRRCREAARFYYALERSVEAHAEIHARVLAGAA